MRRSPNVLVRILQLHPEPLSESLHPCHKVTVVLVKLGVTEVKVVVVLHPQELYSTLEIFLVILDQVPGQKTLKSCLEQDGVQFYFGKHVEDILESGAEVVKSSEYVLLTEGKLLLFSSLLPPPDLVVGVPVLLVELDAASQLLLNDLRLLVPDVSHTVLCDVPPAALDDNIGDLYQKRGHSLRAVVEGRDVVNHLDNVEESEKAFLHILRVF